MRNLVQKKFLLFYRVKKRLKFLDLPKKMLTNLGDMELFSLKLAPIVLLRKI